LEDAIFTFALIVKRSWGHLIERDFLWVNFDSENYTFKQSIEIVLSLFKFTNKNILSYTIN